MAYIIQNQRIGSQPIANTSTTQNHPLGTIVTAYDPTYGGGEFIYLLGVASTAVGSWVSYNPDDNSTALLAANAAGDVAVAMSANVASQYGWYQIKGKAVGKAASGFVDNAEVYATATAGTVDDAVVSGDKVMNVKGASAVDTPSTGLAEFEISRPYIRNGLLVDSTELTATTSELNIMSGVTATAAELNYLDIAALGTGAASKAVVLDSNGDYTYPATGTIVYPSGATLTANSGSTVNIAGTFQLGAVTVGATAAEINAAADVSVRFVNIGDGAAYTVLAANSGKPHVVPNQTANVTITLPAVASGLEYEFTYGGVAADAQNWVIETGAAANFYNGGLVHLDTDAGSAADEIVPIAGNGTSNHTLTIVTPDVGTRVKMVCDGTNWFLSGYVVSATVPSFAG